MFKRFIIITILLSSQLYAQNPPVRISDEGTSQGIPVFEIDCVGTGISCTHSGTKGTINVSAGGGSDTYVTLQEDAVSISSGAPTLDLDSSDFTIVEGLPDEFDITINNSGISITESQISDLQSYLTAETNDLESVATNAGDAEIFVGTGVGTGAYITGLAACAADQKIEYVPGAPDTFTCENITITESDISDLTHTTDTNANTLCTGTTTYLDGEGNCDDISSVYAASSHTHTEADITDLDHTATAITDGIIIEPDLNADNVAVDGDFLQYDATGTNFVWRSGAETLSDIGAAASSHTHATTDVTSGTFADARISASSVHQHLGAWTTWSPTYSGGNGLTLTGTPTTTEAEYREITDSNGDTTVEFFILASVVVNASGGSLKISLPVSTSLTNEMQIGVGHRRSGGWSTRQALICHKQNTDMFCEAESGTAWSASTTYVTVTVFGQYKAY